MWGRLPNTKYQVWIRTKFCVEIKFGPGPLKVGTVANAVHLVRGDHCWQLCATTVNTVWATAGNCVHCGQPTVQSRLLWPIQCSHWTGHHHHWSASISFNFTKISFPLKHLNSLHITLLITYYITYAPWSSWKCEGNPNEKHCQRHNGPRNWLRNLDWTWQQYDTTYSSCNLATRWRRLH